MAEFFDSFIKDFWFGLGQVAEMFGLDTIGSSALGLWASIVVWGKLALILLVAAFFLYLAVTFFLS